MIINNSIFNFERFPKGTLGQKLTHIWWKNMPLKSLEVLVPQLAKSGESGSWATTPSRKMLNICLQSLKKPLNCLKLRPKTLNKMIFLKSNKAFMKLSTRSTKIRLLSNLNLLINFHIKLLRPYVILLNRMPLYSTECKSSI